MIAEASAALPDAFQRNDRREASFPNGVFLFAADHRPTNLKGPAMKRFLPLALAAFGLMALATDAMAAEAYLVDNTDLYAGPDADYPQISSLPAGMPVSVYGCTSAWEWCDVQANEDRGWVSGEFLQYEYQNQRVILPSYGAQIGIPIVAFSLGVYWQAHYHNRPWYGQREDWSHRSFAHRPPPRPAHVQAHQEPVRHPPGPVVNHGPADPRRGVVNDRAHAVNHPSAPDTHPAPAPRVANEHATPTPHPAPHPAPRATAAHPPANAPHPAAVPARTARPAPAQRPKPAPAAKKPPPNKDSDKKDDGHG